MTKWDVVVGVALGIILAKFVESIAGLVVAYAAYLTFTS